MSQRRQRWLLGQAALETLESRVLLDGAPTVSGFLPDGFSNDPYQDVVLDLSAPVDGGDARLASTYTLTHFGPNRVSGGGDDFAVPVFPTYYSGYNQITLTTAVSLTGWEERDYFLNLGLLGDWQTGNSGGTVRQLADGGATFFVSPSNVIDQPFAGRILVDAATTDDDFVGLIFGLSIDATTGRPDSYYLLSWKGAAQGTAEAGVKLVKVTGTGASGETPDFWNLDAADPRFQVLDENAMVPWSAGVAYDFDVDYRSDGTIGVDLMHGDTGELVWSYSGVDPAPLGAGRAGFYNLSQAGVTYSASALGPVALTDGVYQLRATAGNPGLRGMDGAALDGDANGTPGGDFLRTFTIDTVAPVVSGVVAANNALYVTISDIGGMNASATADIAKYTLIASGGDGTFTNGNEIDASASIQAVSYDPANGVVSITLNTLADLADQYELRITGVTDASGNALVYSPAFRFSGSDTQTTANVWKIAGAGAWSTATNWSLARAPTSADTAVIRHSSSVVTSSANVTIAALHSVGTLNVTGGTFRITSSSSIGGTLIISGTGTLAARGASTVVTVGGAVNMNGGSLLADVGATLSMPTLSAYSGGVSSADRVLRADGANSVLSLPALAALTSNSNGYTTYIDAYGGGRVDVPLLTGFVNHSVYFIADGANSRVNIPILASMTGRDGGRASIVDANNGGTIDMPLLTTMSNVAWRIRSAGSMQTAQVTSFTNGQLDAFGGTPDLAQLADVNGSSIIANGGAVVSLPLVTSYWAGALSADRALRATGAGSLLNLSNLATLTSNNSGYTTYIDAYAGGQVSIPAVTAIANNSVYLIAEGAASWVDASGIVTMTGRDGGRTSLIEPRTGGAILLNPSGLTLTNTTMTVSGASPIPWTMSQLQLLAGALLRGDGTIIADVTNTAGDIRPGTSPGGLTIDGSFTQASSAFLTIELGGAVPVTGYDRLTVTGGATLGGTLRVSAVSSYVPAFSAAHTVFVSTAADGDFSTYQGLDLGSNRILAPSWADGDLTLTPRFGNSASIPQSSAARVTIPPVPGDGVFIELFNGIGGGTTPLPSHLDGRTPSGITLSPFIDFPRPGSTINVGSSFNNFFANTTVPPEQVSGLAASNFILRGTFYLAVSREMDLDPATSAIDMRLGVGSDDGYHLTVGSTFLGSAGDRGFTYTWAGASFEGPGLYPVTLLFAANSVGQSGLEFSWQTALSGATEIVPQSALYISSTLGDRAITFEELPAGTAIADQYLAEGIRFEVLGGDLQITDARPTDFLPVSEDRVYGDPAAGPVELGQVQWTFVAPGTSIPAATDFISFYVIDAESVGATVTAFSADDQVLFSGDYHAGGRTQELVVIQRQGIARVLVTLGQGTDTSAIDNLTFNTPVALNRRPEIIPIADQEVDELTPLSVQVIASDPDQPEQSISFSLEPGSPAGASIHPTSGLFTWTPTEAQGHGTYLITVRVSDNAATPLSATTSFSVVVYETNRPPSMQFVTDRRISATAPLSFTISGGDPDLPAQQLTYSLDAGAPAGTTIHPQTGLFTWTVDRGFPEGVYPITARVTDPGNLDASTTFNVTVDHTGPAVTGISPSGVITGTLQQITVTFNEEITPASVQIVDFSLSGPLGPIAISGVQQLGPAQWRLSFASQSTGGHYALTVGPAINDLTGNAMNQDGDLVNGQPSDAFVGVVTLNDQKAPFIVLASPLGPVAQAVSAITVQFSEQIDPATFVTADVAIDGPNGPISATSVLPASPTTFIITLPAQPVEGDYPFTIGPNIADIQGNNLAAAYSGLFSIDRTGPRIIEMAPQGTVGQAVSSVLLRFDSAVHASSFTAADIALSGPGGAIPPSITRINETEYRVDFTAQRANGLYTLSAGPNITDLAGNAMDQDQDGTPGEAIDDRFAGSFTIALPDLDPDIGPTPLPAAANHGQTIDIDWIVRNLGVSAAAGTWIDRVYLSIDGQVSSGDRLLLTRPGGPLPVANQYTASAGITLPADITLPEGSYHILVQTDGANAIDESIETNNVVSLGTLQLSLPLMPDLVIGGIDAPATAEPGQQVQVSWTVQNTQGIAASGEWTIELSLSSDAIIGLDLLLDTLSFSGVVPANGGIPQSHTLTIPALGVGGNQWVVVKVVAGQGIFERDPDNNASIAADPLHVPAWLTLSASASSIAEDAANPILRGSVTRSGSAALPLVVNLLSNKPGELTVPAIVTIPAGHYAAAFDMMVQPDDVLDGSQLVTISATATGFENGAMDITVIDAQKPSVAVALAASEGTEGQAIQGTVTRDLVTSASLLVSLVASRGGQITFPATITIPAGEASAAFVLSIVDDAVPEKDLSLTLTATAAGHLQGARDLLILDNDLPTLSIELDAYSMPEGAGPMGILGRIRRTEAAPFDQPVKLTSSDASEAMLPAQVIIPAGLDFVEFHIAAVDDAIVDGAQAVIITAVGILPDCGCQTPNPTGSTSAQIMVLDDDGPALSIVIDRQIVAEGTHGTATVVVSRNTDAGVELVVSLSSSDTTELTLPESITISAGRFQSDPVPLTSLDDGIADGNQTVTITAMAAGYADGSAQIVVTDVNLADLVVSHISAPSAALAERYFDITYRITNTGFAAALGLQGWQDRVFLSDDPFIGGDIPVGTYTFSGELPVGVSFERTVPAFSPVKTGQYWIVVVTDLGDSVQEALESNNARVSTQPILIAPAYSATVETAVETALAGTSASPTIIPLTGRATMTETGAAAPAGTLVNVHVTVAGARRIISAFTDAAGKFSIPFKLLPGEGGRYSIGAAHPGVAEAPVQDQFVVLGMKASLPASPIRIIEGQSATGGIIIRNLSDIALTGLDANLISAPGNVIAAFDLPAILGGGAEVELTYDLAAIDATTPGGAVLVRLTSAEGAVLDVPLNVAVESLRPVLAPNVALLQAAMLKGEQRIVGFIVTNAGGAETGPMVVDLPQASWLALATSPNIPSLQPGQSTQITLLLTPDADLPLTIYDGSLSIRSGDTPLLTMPFSFRHVSDATGTLEVMVVDELFYFTSGSPRLEGATVTLQDPFTGMPLFSAVSSADGLVTTPALNEGYYVLEVDAPQHDLLRRTIFLSAGRLNTELAFVSRQTVQYNWTVEEIEVEDRTRITIETVFETNVPAPVVTIDPPLIDLSDLQLIGQTMQIDMTITNHGLIAAEGVELDLGTHPFYDIKPLIREIGTLPAKSSVTIPVVITRVGDFTEAESSAEAGTVPCSIPGGVFYFYICGPGGVYKKVPVAFNGVEGDCGGGPGGFWAVVGGGAGGGSIDPRGVSVKSDCDECAIERLKALLNCVVGFIPGVGCPKGIYDCVNDLSTGGLTWESGLKCAWSAIGCAADLGPVGKVIDGLICIYDIIHACDKLKKGGAESGGLYLINAESASGTLGGALAVLEQRGQWLADSIEWLYVLFGDPTWLNSGSGANLTEFLRAFQAASAETSELGLRISEAEQLALESLPAPEGVDVSKVTVFIQRWNRTADYWAAGIFNSTDLPAGSNPDFIGWDHWTDAAERGNAAVDAAQALGYPSPSEAAMAARQDLYDIMVDKAASDGVCATVRLQINQEAVMTRQGFKATLELINKTDAPLEAVAVGLRVLDGTGADVTHLFGIYPPTLSNIGAVDGTGAVLANTTGSAAWTIVPTLDAAPSGPTQYYVAGTLTYTEAGLDLTVELVPTPITVLPQAELYLDYFHQRDVISDDPHTDPIEPAEPFVMAAMVRNEGNGAATNLRITSAQPEIIENDKGLLIDFRIIATQVAGEYITPTLTADFGDIAPGGIKIGQWFLVSTLQGQFLEYNATFEHIDGLGNPRLSIIQGVAIHELIRSVSAPGTYADSLPDFLVNDLPDLADLPDTLYLSDGSVESVGLGINAAHDGVVTASDLVVQLTAEMPAGFSYVRTSDPGGTEYRLIRVVRSDGSELPVENFWQTDRTFIEGGRRPVYENNLHLFDLDSTGVYTLYYESRDQAGPYVAEIEQPGPEPLSEPVSSIALTFSEDLAPGSFGIEDLALTRDGSANLINNDVAIVAIDARSYRIEGLTYLTDIGGEYVLTIDTTGILDTFGNTGAGPASVFWSRLPDVPVVISIDGLGAVHRTTPAGTLDVTFSEPINSATFAVSDLVLTRNGQPVALSDGFSISQVGPATFRLASLEALTATEGTYILTVHSSGVEDLEGNAGLGSSSVTWKMDLTPPIVEQIVAAAGPVTRFAVPAIDIHFSEEIDPFTFSIADVSLTRNGGDNLLGAGLIIQRIAPTHWRISGLSGITGIDGVYQVSIDASTFTDLAGNPGVGILTASWSADTTPPAPATSLAIAPDAGISSTDGLTNTLSMTLSGTLGETGLAVTVFDQTLGQALGAADVIGTGFSKPLNFSVPGVHRILIRATDAVGNSRDSFFDVFVDLVGPDVQSFLGVPAGLWWDPVSEIDVIFTEGVDPATFTTSDITLKRGGVALNLTGVTITPLSPASFRLANLPAVADGLYELTISLSQITDRAGAPGTSEAIAAWTIRPADSTPPAVDQVFIGDAQPQRSDVDRITIRFSEEMDLAPLLANGSIISAVTLIHHTTLGPASIPLAPAQFSYDPDTFELHWSGDTLTPGRYELRLADSMLRDLRGNAMSDDPRISFSLGQVVQAGAATLQTEAYSVPTMADWNGDGLPDLIVGEKATAGGKIRIYLNSGSVGSPAFTTYTYAQSGGADLVLPASGCLGAYPRVADWNGDGLIDLVVGLADGTLRFYANATSNTDPAFDAGSFIQVGQPGLKLNIDVGDRAAPEIVDWNNDGRLDLLVGSLDGKVRLYINQASAAGLPDLRTVAFVRAGGADITAPNGRSAPAVADVDGDGRKDLIIGNTSGQLFFYNNIGTDAQPIFLASAPLYAGDQLIDLAGDARSRPFLADFNADGRLDLLVGAADGLVRVYLGESPAGMQATSFHALSVAWDAVVEIGELASFAIDAGPETLSFTWDFDDASPAGTGMSQSHAWTGPGTYFVTATTTDLDGFAIVQTMRVAVLPGPRDGTPGDDVFMLRVDDAGEYAEFYENRTLAEGLTFRLPIDVLPSLTYSGLDGDDTLIVDFANGNPLPTSALNFPGGAGVNRVRLIGNPSTTAGAFAPGAAATGAGQVTVGGRAINFAAQALIEVDGFATFSARPGGTAASVFINEDAGNTVFTGVTDGVPFLPFRVSNSGQVLLDLSANAGDDTIAIGNIAPVSSSSPWIRIDAGGGTNQVHITGGAVKLQAAGDALTLTAASADITLDATHALESLTLAGASTLRFTPNHKHLLELESLTLSDDATLDLARSDLAIATMPQTQADILNMIRAAVEKARTTGGSGPWSGVGITSSVSAVNPMTEIKVVLNDRGGGQPLVPALAGRNIPATHVIAKQTWLGDLNLNDVVDGADYFRIDHQFLTGIPSVVSPDLNRDGSLDGDDYFLMDQSFLAQEPLPTPAAIPFTASPIPIEAGQADSVGHFVALSRLQAWPASPAATSASLKAAVDLNSDDDILA